MNKATIEKALANALNSEPTISFAELAIMPYIKMSEHDYITAQEGKKTSAHLRQFALAAVCCLFVMVSLSGWYLQNRITSSTITLDVNPSIQIITNRKDQVLFVKALNEDAQRIVGEKDYKDTKLEETVVTLMNSLVDQKYLDQDKNTILLSVINKNSQKADAILTEVDRTIREILAAQNITPTIMRQIIAKEKDRNDLANKYHISEGKMNLIQSMIALNNKFTLDMLANMSIEQLLKLAEENSMDLSEYLSIDDEETQSKENFEDLQEDTEEGEDQEVTSSIEDDDEQGENSEDHGEDSEGQGEDNEEDSEDNQEDEDTYGNDDSDSDSKEKAEEEIGEENDSNEDNDQSDSVIIDSDTEDENNDIIVDASEDNGDSQVDTIENGVENEDIDQEDIDQEDIDQEDIDQEDIDQEDINHEEIDQEEID